MVSTEPAEAREEETKGPPPEKPVDVGQEPAEAKVEEQEQPVETEDEEKPRSGYARKKLALERTRQEVAEKDRRIAELEARVEKLKPQPPEEQPPKVEDFNGDYLAHQNAMAAYYAAQGAAKGASKVVDERLGSFLEKQNQEREAAQYQSAVSEWSERLLEQANESGLKNIEADAERLKQELGPFPTAIRATMFRTENAAPIISYLAKNLEYAADLYAKSPDEQVFELGKLEAKMSLPDARKATKAPPPFKAPKGGAAPPADVYQAAKAENITDYIKVRKAMEKKD